ncbi:membrane protein insertase YidC [Pseudomarimonas arenosa]|uniref:Membrane protein insertase YidC n=1 Tax=Pseudomarimonas arenosa TaxID=2774145 RepID=A0AAW3ZMF0_9GAMM|nr:membrane protein insertase YidC [Pseudomarimonas arenosa]MBD8526362.1 membrane protein insertase YidC [Pseudomarimonas arenosa]
MNQIRTFLLIAWLLVGFLLWEAWQREQATPATDQTSEQPAAISDAALPSADSDAALPLASREGSVEPADSASGGAPAGRRIQIETDVLRLEVDTQGVALIGAELKRYGVSPGAESQRIVLFSDSGKHFFIAQQGWVADGQPAPNHQQYFDTPNSEYRLAKGEDELRVPFTWQGENGLSLTRELVLRRGQYAIDVVETLDNRSSELWTGNAYRQFTRVPPEIKSGFTHPEAYSFTGVAWFSEADKFNKIPFDDIEGKEDLKVSANRAWVAMLQHYFFAAWIPTATDNVTITVDHLSDRGRYLIRAFSPKKQVAPGEQLQQSVQLYVGPKLQEQLAAVAPGLELAIDYGILTVLSEPLFWLLSWFHALVGNWGWAIIMLVVVIKAAFFKLSETQYKSFAKMRAIQPRIESLKERYGDDRQKFNMAMMELYKKEKINPMGGCLPILLQIPVFLALYWVLLESVELRHAPWVLWIQNLSAPDPYFVLPVLNLLTMWLTQKLSPTPGMDPMQKKMMQAMPLVFGVMFAFFPAGLVLYWTVNGALGLLQQWVITRRHGAPAKA